jgi:hypothetical protein
MAATHATVTKGGVATALVGNLPAVGSQAPTVLGTNHELKDITLDSDELKGKVKILNVKLPPFLPSFPSSSPLLYTQFFASSHVIDAMIRSSHQ